MNRFYIDYNSQAPLSSKVLSFFYSLDSSLANASSLHQSGQRTQGLVEEAENYIRSLFHLDEGDQILFHSGTTEFLNYLHKSYAQYEPRYSNISHPASRNSLIYHQGHLTQKNDAFFSFKMDQKGELEIQNWDVLSKEENQKVLSLYDVALMENEVSYWWSPLERTQLEDSLNKDDILHWDASQWVGKRPSWNKDISQKGFTTFSGHKFGALTGIGMTIIPKDLKMNTPLLYGGGQQKGLRSGTLNTYGILSMAYALKDYQERTLDDKNYFSKLMSLKNSLTQVLKHYVADVIILEKKSLSQDEVSSPTLSWIDPQKRADYLFLHLDQYGLEASMGSACSAGLLKNNPVLEVLLKSADLCQDLSRHGVRFSLGPDLIDVSQDIVDRFEKVMKVTHS